MHIKIFIGLLMLWILGQMACNWIEGQEMLTDTDMMHVSNLTETRSFNVADTSGTDLTAVSMGVGFFDTVKEIFLFDFSFFYDYDANTGLLTPNNFMILRYFLLCVVIACLIELALTLRSLILGS